MSLLLAQLATTTTDAGSSFTAPKVDYAGVAPMLIVFGAGLVSVLVEAFVPRKNRFLVQVVLTLLTFLAALVALVAFAINGNLTVTAGRAVSLDGPALFLQGTILALALVATLITAEQSGPNGSAFAAAASAVPGSSAEAASRRAGLVQSEIYPLLLFSVGGMLVFPAANDLLTMFVALEVLSLPLYLLCGLARRRRLLSQEASMKYFLLGAFSSAFFLFGAAMLYGFAGSVVLDDIATAVARETGMDGLLLLGTGMLAVGLLFKVGAAPFHAWTPDVYQGAPTPITGFMAACTKVAAFGALLRLFYVGLPNDRWDWQLPLGIVAILTMVVGSVVAVVQADVKRMLAYSSVAHAGFILVGFLAVDKDGVSSILYYLVAYGFGTVGAFALVTLVRTASPEGGVGGEATHLSQWAGLGRRSPLLAAAFTLFLLSFAGIPLTAGFIGKFAVFSAAVAHAGPWGSVLAVVGVLCSAIAAFFYIRVIVLLYFGGTDEETGAEEGSSTSVPLEVATDASGEAGTAVATAVRTETQAETAIATSSTIVTAPGFLTILAVAICVVVTVGLGVAPDLILNLADRAAIFIP